MPFKITYRGLQVECDTIDEINRLAEELESTKAREARKARRATKNQPINTTLFQQEESIRTLVHELKTNQRKLLAEVSKAEKSDTELREILELENNKALAGVLSGISKLAKRLGMEHAPIDARMTRSRSGGREYRYSIRPEALEEVQKALLNGHA